MAEVSVDNLGRNEAHMNGLPDEQTHCSVVNEHPSSCVAEPADSMEKSDILSASVLSLQRDGNDASLAKRKRDDSDGWQMDSAGCLSDLKSPNSQRSELTACPSPDVQMAQAKKKSKVEWTPDLHRRFAQAVEKLGVDKAIPSKILELMGVKCLTRHNIASHLQKYRSHRRHLQAKECGEAAKSGAENSGSTLAAAAPASQPGRAVRPPPPGSVGPQWVMQPGRMAAPPRVGVPVQGRPVIGVPSGGHFYPSGPVSLTHPQPPLMAANGQAVGPVMGVPVWSPADAPQSSTWQSGSVYPQHVRWLGPDGSIWHYGGMGHAPSPSPAAPAWCKPMAPPPSPSISTSSTLTTSSGQQHAARPEPSAPATMPTPGLPMMPAAPCAGVAAGAPMGPSAFGMAPMSAMLCGPVMGTPVMAPASGPPFAAPVSHPLFLQSANSFSASSHSLNAGPCPPSQSPAGAVTPSQRPSQQQAERSTEAPVLPPPQTHASNDGACAAPGTLLLERPPDAGEAGDAAGSGSGSQLVTTSHLAPVSASSGVCNESVAGSNQPFSVPFCFPKEGGSGVAPRDGAEEDEAMPEPMFPFPLPSDLLLPPGDFQLPSLGAEELSGERIPGGDLLDAAISEALANPLTPLPLGLRPPSLEGVLEELQRQGLAVPVGGKLEAEEGRGAGDQGKRGERELRRAAQADYQGVGRTSGDPLEAALIAGNKKAEAGGMGQQGERPQRGERSTGAPVPPTPAQQAAKTGRAAAAAAAAAVRAGGVAAGPRREVRWKDMARSAGAEEARQAAATAAAAAVGAGRPSGPASAKGPAAGVSSNASAAGFLVPTAAPQLLPCAATPEPTPVEEGGGAGEGKARGAMGEECGGRGLRGEEGAEDMPGFEGVMSAWRTEVGEGL